MAAAFDQIGRAAVKAGTKLQIAVYGGSALMLASNFRFATEDGARVDGLLGGVAEYLAHQFDLPKVPAWAYSPVRYLDRAWHASSMADDGFREYLTFASPAEFASRNIFTEERPLRRARGPQPVKT